MKAAVKKRWIEALLSGKFVQGQKRLRPTKDTYCCLGVLAKVEGETFRKGRKLGNDYGIRGDESKERATGMLPKWFLEKVGLSERQQGKLASKNDAGADFPTLATYIQRYVKAT